MGRRSHLVVPVSHVIAGAATGAQVLLQLGRQRGQEGLQGPERPLGEPAAGASAQAVRGAAAAPPASVAPAGHSTTVGGARGRGAAHLHAVVGALQVAPLQGWALGAAQSDAPVRGWGRVGAVQLTVHAVAFASSHDTW